MMKTITLFRDRGMWLASGAGCWVFLFWGSVLSAIVALGGSAATWVAQYPWPIWLTVFAGLLAFGLVIADQVSRRQAHRRLLTPPMLLNQLDAARAAADEAATVARIDPTHDRSPYRKAVEVFERLFHANESQIDIATHAVVNKYLQLHVTAMHELEEAFGPLRSSEWPTKEIHAGIVLEQALKAGQAVVSRFRDVRSFSPTAEQAAIRLADDPRRYARIRVEAVADESGED